MTLRGGHLNPAEQEKARGVGHTGKVFGRPHCVVFSKTQTIQPGSATPDHQLSQAKLATQGERMRMRMEIDQHTNTPPFVGK
jgi:hypothetical protein